MKKLFFLYVLLFISKYSLSQTILSGKVIDKSTGEPLIGATIIYGKGKGTATATVYYDGFAHSAFVSYLS